MATERMLSGHHENGAKPSGYIAPATKLSESVLNLKDIKTNLSGVGCGEHRKSHQIFAMARFLPHHTLRNLLYMSKDPSFIPSKGLKTPYA